MVKRSTLFFSIVTLFFIQSPVFADNDEGKNCPVGLVSGMTLDEEFGAGTADITRCLKKERVKVVYQANQYCKNATCSQPYLLGNVRNAIKDYKITHGMADRDFEIVVVVHSGGTGLILNNDTSAMDAPRNPFAAQVEELLDQGVKFYYCQNTARKKGVTITDLIPGVGFVTAGVTAIADFQALGYSYVQP